MSTDNKEQGNKNGTVIDDKSKTLCDSQGSSGGSDASVAEPKPATTNTVANRGGVTIDDRSKGFEV